MTTEDDMARLKRISKIAEKASARLEPHRELLASRSSAVRIMEQRIEALNSRNSTVLDILETFNRRSRVFEAASGMFAQSPALAQLEAMQDRAQNAVNLGAMSIFPDVLGLEHVAERLAASIEPLKVASLSASAWQEQLEVRMAAIEAPWIDTRLPSLSLEGFAIVSRLNQAARFDAPFEDSVREKVDEDLGRPIEVEDRTSEEEESAAHLEAGMNPSLLVLPQAAIGDVLIQAGFTFSADILPVPPSLDRGQPALSFQFWPNLLIAATEQNLRQLVSDRLFAEYGAGWLAKCVHEDAINKWTERRAAAIDKGESRLDILQYSDFMDLKTIIVRRSHWRDVFAPIFKNKHHFETAMDRLHSIRLPVAHSRPIGVGQQITLVSEASAVLSPLGINIFSQSKTDRR